MTTSRVPPSPAPCTTLLSTCRFYLHAYRAAVWRPRRNSFLHTLQSERLRHAGAMSVLH